MVEEVIQGATELIAGKPVRLKLWVTTLFAALTATIANLRVMRIFERADEGGSGVGNDADAIIVGPDEAAVLAEDVSTFGEDIARIGQALRCWRLRATSNATR